jgi:hypothetical protein
LAEGGHGPTSSGVAAVAATHRVSWQGERDVVVETDWELALDAPAAGPAPWRFPVEGTRDIAAELDGVAVPVRIEPGGKAAAVSVSGEGRHRLRVRRVATPRRAEAGEALSVPILPVPSARVVADDGPDGRRVELPGARGRVGPRAGGVEAGLGPADRLDVRWVAGGEDQAAALSGAVDGLILWDVVPAGDRVRARLSYRNPAGTSAIRIGLEPGVVVRPVAVPGLMDAVVQGPADRPEWLASIDPPLPDGATVALEFWRPLAPPGRPGDRPSRSLPRIEPLGVERFGALLALRRPGDWSGRLTAFAAGAGAEPMTEETFVKAWGALPDEPLTLSGAVRLAHATAVALEAGPPADRLVVQPAVQLSLAAGRVEVRLEADLVAASGWADRVEFEVPHAFRIASVEADGLTDWSRRGGRVLLLFDGPPARSRKLRLSGWAAIPSDPLEPGPAVQEVVVPWPRWVDADARPGTLTVSAAAPFQLVDPGPGVVALGPGTAAGPSSATTRRAYRVDRPDDLGRLRWEVEPPRVGVQILSRLTVHPDSAEWVAVLQYDVAGGAGDAVLLRLPTAWAASARVEVVGEGHTLVTEARGATTTWMIRPAHPIWGSRRVVVRSSIASPAGQALAFPELHPLGRSGGADTYLAIANASGRGLAIEGSPGLQPIEDRSRFRDGAFAGQLGSITSAYHVTASPGWSLKIQPDAGPGRSPTGREPARVALADLSCTMRPDGSSLGSARYEVDPRAGPFLPVELPGGAEPIWAAVDGSPATPLRSASGRWLVPLPDGGAGQVLLIWETPASGVRPGDARPLALPVADDDRVPTLVTVDAPEGVAVRSVSPAFRPAGPERLEVARAEWQGRRAAETFGTIDRSSLRDREALVSELVRFELLLRGAERVVALGMGGVPATAAADRARLVWERSRAARAALGEAVEAAGLDEFTRAAEVHLGRAPDDPEEGAVAIPEPITPARVRRIGRPAAFLGESAGPGQPSPLVWSPAPPRVTFARADLQALALALLMAPPLAAYLVRPRGLAIYLGLAALPPALAAVAVVAGPWALIAALALLALGRVGS